MKLWLLTFNFPTLDLQERQLINCRILSLNMGL